MTTVLIPLKEVERRIGLKQSRIYQMVAEKKFPQPVKIGVVNRWVEAEVETWIQERVACRS